MNSPSLSGTFKRGDRVLLFPTAIFSDAKKWKKLSKTGVITPRHPNTRWASVSKNPQTSPEVWLLGVPFTPILTRYDWRILDVQSIWHQPNQCTIKKEILQMYHTFNHLHQIWSRDHVTSLSLTAGMHRHWRKGWCEGRPKWGPPLMGIPERWLPLPLVLGAPTEGVIRANSSESGDVEIRIHVTNYSCN